MLEDLEKRNLEELTRIKIIVNNQCKYLFARNSEEILNLISYAGAGNYEARLRLYELYSCGLYIPANGYRVISWFKNFENLNPE